ncbi:MAG TPA: hypothetical protein VF678_16450 [bacterium]
MRKILLALIALLTVTGLPLAFGWIAASHGGWEKAVVLVHIWGGVGFIVVFPLYAWDHIRTNRHWLERTAGVTASGLGQLTVGVLLILSGVLLLAYGSQVWQALRDFHHAFTYFLLVALAGHFLSPKRWE